MDIKQDELIQYRPQFMFNKVLLVNCSTKFFNIDSRPNETRSFANLSILSIKVQIVVVMIEKTPYQVQKIMQEMERLTNKHQVQLTVKELFHSSSNSR
jgi:hypothetical protein